jgi:hypothetical protein
VVTVVVGTATEEDATTVEVTITVGDATAEEVTATAEEVTATAEEVTAVDGTHKPVDVFTEHPVEQMIDTHVVGGFGQLTRKVVHVKAFAAGIPKASKAISTNMRISLTNATSFNLTNVSFLSFKQVFQCY